MFLLSTTPMNNVTHQRTVGNQCDSAADLATGFHQSSIGDYKDILAIMAEYEIIIKIWLTKAPHNNRKADHEWITPNFQAMVEKL
jgi:hypothetical protein